MRPSTGKGSPCAFAEMKDPVRAKIEQYELTRTIDPTHFFPTVESAVAAFGRLAQTEVEAPRDEVNDRDGSVD